MNVSPALAAALLACLTIPLRAATLPAAEDSSSTRGQLTKQTNKAATLSVNAKRTAYVYFDLAALPVSTAAQVRYARLRLYFPKVGSAGGGLSVHVVNGQWDEAVATAEPSHEETAEGTIDPLALATKRFASVDVTEAVRAWVEGTADNEGFALLAVNGTSLAIGAKEGSGTGYPAELDVELNPDPGSVASELLAANLTLAGVTTGTFSGNGSALLSLTTANLTGLIMSGQLSTNLTLGGTTTGTFSGSGAGLINLQAQNITGLLSGAQIANGAVGNAQLASNLTLAGTTAGTFSGDGSALVGLAAANITGQLTNGQIAAGIDAAKLGNGSISNAELAFLDGATGNLQGQLAGKVSKAGDTINGPLEINGTLSVTGALRIPGAGVGSNGSAFIHTTVAGNVLSVITHPLCDGDPNAFLIVTHKAGAIHNHPVGVAYDGAKWYVFNEDYAFMPAGVTFNVLVIKP